MCEGVFQSPALSQGPLDLSPDALPARLALPCPRSSHPCASRAGAEAEELEVPQAQLCQPRGAALSTGQAEPLLACPILLGGQHGDGGTACSCPGAAWDLVLQQHWLRPLHETPPQPCPPLPLPGLLPPRSLPRPLSWHRGDQLCRQELPGPRTSPPLPTSGIQPQPGSRTPAQRQRGRGSVGLPQGSCCSQQHTLWSRRPGANGAETLEL